MINKIKIYFPFVLLTILGIMVLSFFYGRILLNPSNYVFSDSGDGIKAMYVYQWHIKHDQNAHQTTAINYPYGETFIYPDGQILIANIVRLLAKYNPWFIDHSIGIVNFLMVFSYLICFWALFWILLRLKLNKWHAVFLALAIGMLSPQLFRFLGHPTLSYVCFLPLLMLFALQMIQAKNQNSIFSLTIALIFLITAFCFIHPYYGMIGALFLSAFWFFHWVLSGGFNFKRAVLKAFSIITPLAITFLYQKWADLHTGRAKEPYGLLDYMANPNTILFPVYPPFDFLFRMVFGNYSQEWEGWAYIGTSTLIGISVIVIASLFSVMRKTFKLSAFSDEEKIVFSFFLTGIVAMIYSCAWIFQLGGLKLLNAMPFLWQFRSLGRFAWIVFYCFNIVAAFALSRFVINQFRIGAKLGFGNLLFTIYIVTLLIEGWFYHSDVAPKVSRASNKFIYQNMDFELKELVTAAKASGCQAILPLPYFHIGSESYSRSTPEDTYSKSFYLAYHSGIPLIASSGARASQMESRKQVQSLALPFFPKEAKIDYPSNDPVLVFTNGDPLAEDEQSLLSGAQLLGEFGKMKLYKLPLNSYFGFDNRSLKESISRMKNSMVMDGQQFLINHNMVRFLFKSYDAQIDASYKFCGPGALKSSKREYTFIFNSTTDSFPLSKDSTYVLSCWYYSKGEAIMANTLFVEEFISQQQTTKYLSTKDVSGSSQIVGDWTRLELRFRPEQNGSEIRAFFHSGDPNDKPIWVDQLLLRNEIDSVSWSSYGNLFLNNIPVF